MSDCKTVLAQSGVQFSSLENVKHLQWLEVLFNFLEMSLNQKYVCVCVNSQDFPHVNSIALNAKESEK